MVVMFQSIVAEKYFEEAMVCIMFQFRIAGR